MGGATTQPRLLNSDNTVEREGRWRIRVRVSGCGDISGEIREAVPEAGGSLNFISRTGGANPGQFETAGGPCALSNGDRGRGSIVMEDVNASTSVAGAAVCHDKNAGVGSKSKPRVMESNV